MLLTSVQAEASANDSLFIEVGRDKTETVRSVELYPVAQRPSPAAFCRDVMVVHVTLGSIKRSSHWAYQRKASSPCLAADQTIALSIPILYITMDVTLYFPTSP